MRYLTLEEVIEWKPPVKGDIGADRRQPLRQALFDCGQFHSSQTAGRFFPIACVALEVTQKCNLDCSLCYLSDHAELAHDVPLAVLLRRIDMIEQHYGPKTSVQITGGDPTLRAPEHLEDLCRYIRKRSMRSCLMTNGIRATDTLLGRLARAGLDDVAFHVDLTQERTGYPTEMSLNSVRKDYVRRARAVGLRVMFNTTVFDGNLDEISALAGFFRQNSHQITLVSFQMQADTGRGRIRRHSGNLTTAGVKALLEKGIGARIGFDVAAVGHASCTQYGAVLVAGDRAVPALDNQALFEDLLEQIEKREVRDGETTNVAATLRKLLPRHPILALRILSYLASRLWHLGLGLWSSRGRVHRMSVMVHNFMDAKKLEEERCKSCVFMVASEAGPISMCVHNARRDAHVFAPARIELPNGPGWWSAHTGKITAMPDQTVPDEIPRKQLKGRLREKARATKIQSASRQ
jgi:pyruvate-formate lyase-activating enzyme